jgi:hypothetical protein
MKKPRPFRPVLLVPKLYPCFHCWQSLAALVVAWLLRLASALDGSVFHNIYGLALSCFQSLRDVRADSSNSEENHNG